MSASARRLEPFLLAAVLLVAALLRFHDLDAIPPGLTHDEADLGFYAAAVARGAPAHYEVPYGYAYEPFGQYSAGLLMRFLGASDYALRAHQTLYGLLIVGLIYAWTRRAFGWKAAASAALLAATLFWTVFTSRMALNSQPAPALFLLAAIALWRGFYPARKPTAAVNGAPGRAGGSPLRTTPQVGASRRDAHAQDTPSKLVRLLRGKNLWWLVFALAVALMLHIYEAARAAWFALPAFGLYLLVTDWPRVRRHGIKFIVALGAGSALALPHLLDPGAWGRTEALGGAMASLLAGNPEPLVRNVLEGLATLTFSGDTLITYNLPGRPVLGPLEGVFLYIGVFYCLINLRRAACAFLLLWLGFGLAPTLITGAYTSTLHSIAAQPVICILPAVGAMGLVRWMRGRGWRQEAAVISVIWVLVLAQVGLRTAYDYFVEWGNKAETRAVYFHTLGAMTARIDHDAAQGGVVALSTPFPEPPLDPFIGLMRIHNPAVDVRWMDARRAVILPPVETAHLFTSADAPLDPYLAALLEFQHVEHVETTHPGDLNPYYDIYEFDSETARARLDAALPNIDGLAVFGGAAAMRGCRADFDPDSHAVIVATRWAVLDVDALGAPPPTQYAHELKIFVHALDRRGAIIGQEDVLGAPASDWRAGDVFVHVHYIQLPKGTPPVGLRLVLGVYNRIDGTRLPLTIDGAPAGDMLRLACSSQSS
ncbi:MAG: glycosyltransferase family 39 protein [Anaerolineae bacterium]|nr:glycosyltransferase family 39 protein [Anaerolineae bacterium]